MAGVQERSVAYPEFWDCLLTRKGRNIYVSDFFRDSVTHAGIFGL